MTQPTAIPRRDMLKAALHWSEAALAIAGLGGAATGCIGERDHKPTPKSYSDYANYSDYFDYANYADYSNYGDGPYGDYTDYANYANYGDYFDYADAYSDSYADYSNYSNYSDYGDYSDYSDYANTYTDSYSDAYSDAYTDGYADAYVDAYIDGTAGASARAATGKARKYADYADYADAYVDAMTAGAEACRVRVPRPPRRGEDRPPLREGAGAARSETWREAPDRVDRALDLPATARPRIVEAQGQSKTAGPRQAHQGDAKEWVRPKRQKPGRRICKLSGEKPAREKQRP